jgi:signal transduction histidine kinase
LQNGGGADYPVDITQSLQLLLLELGSQWGLDCRLSGIEHPLLVPPWMEHPIRQIVREAAANSVRHGRASRVECELSQVGEVLRLNLSDDGGGFALQGEFDELALREKGLTPWSIYERTKGLGGSVSLFSDRGGSQLRLEVPLRPTS